MKKLLLGTLLLLMCIPSLALDTEFSYDYYTTPNSGNNYNDGQGISARVFKDLTKNVDIFAEVSHMTDIEFPVPDDPKGSFGELRSYGVGGGLKLHKDINDRFTTYLIASLGYNYYDFKENPFLQDNHVTVDVEGDWYKKAGVGLTYQLNQDWGLFAESGWFDSGVPKKATDNQGTEWHIMGDEEIGLEYIYVKLGGKVKF